MTRLHVRIVQRLDCGLLQRLPVVQFEQQQRSHVHLQRRLLDVGIRLVACVHRYRLSNAPCVVVFRLPILTLRIPRLYSAGSLLGRLLQRERHVLRAVPDRQQRHQHGVHDLHVQRRLLLQRLWQQPCVHRYA